nr:hypothetical protein Iba_scaffold14541.2CG0410 [Ipomoea batatas]
MESPREDTEKSNPSTRHEWSNEGIQCKVNDNNEFNHCGRRFDAVEGGISMNVTLMTKAFRAFIIAFLAFDDS